MSLFGAIDTSASALTAGRLWLNLISNNLANVDTTVASGGVAYREEEPVFAARPSGGVAVVGIWQNPTAGPRIYQPGNPAADAQGYVQGSNVDPAGQMVNVIAATRTYEANVTVLNDEKMEFQKGLSVIE